MLTVLVSVVGSWRTRNPIGRWDNDDDVDTLVVDRVFVEESSNRKKLPVKRFYRINAIKKCIDHLLVDFEPLTCTATLETEETKE